MNSFRLLSASGGPPPRSLYNTEEHYVQSQGFLVLIYVTSAAAIEASYHSQHHSDKLS